MIIFASGLIIHSLSLSTMLIIRNKIFISVLFFIFLVPAETYCAGSIRTIGELVYSLGNTGMEGYFLAVLLFVVIQAVFIIYLVRLNRRQKETARQRAETENIYQEMVREDRLLKMVELTASLSHELNQPLTAILYNAQAGKRFLKSGTIDPRRPKKYSIILLKMISGPAGSSTVLKT